MRRPTSPPARGRPAARLRLEPLEARDTPAVFTVTNTNSSGTNSLDWAIARANANAGPDEIVFAPVLFTTPKTIALTQSLPQINSIFSAADALTITGPGADLLTITRAANAGQFTMIRGYSGDLTLKGFTVAGGDATDDAGGVSHGHDALRLEDMVFTDNKGVQGGAVHAEFVIVHVRNSTFTGNAAESGGGLYVRQGGAIIHDTTFAGNRAALGGGIYAGSGRIEALRATFTGNEAAEAGGAAYVNSGSIQALHTTVADNTAGSRGGGLNVRIGNLEVRDSTVTGNAAVEDFGGGLYLGQAGAFEGGHLDIERTVVAGNTSGSNGGGLYVSRGTDVDIRTSTFRDNVAGGFGGGASFRHVLDRFLVEGCTFEGNTAEGGGGGLFLQQLGEDESDPHGVIRNCTVTGNTAGDRGGGISAALLDTPLQVEHCTVTGNTSTDASTQTEGGIGGGGVAHSGVVGILKLRNTVVSGNTHPTAPDLLGRLYPVEVRSCAIGSALGFTPTATSGDNLPFDLDLQLGPLADNGGPTWTRHPAYGSPLIDVGSNALVAPGVTTDQRGDGFVRTAGLSTDMGAVELQPVTVAVNQSAAQPDPTPTGPITFTVAFSEPVTGFTAADVDFAGSTAGGPLAATVSGSGKDYTVTVTEMTTTGDVVVSVPAGVAETAIGVPNLASVSADNVVRFDIDGPTATIDRAAGQPDPTSVNPVRFRVVFSEPVTGFDAADVGLAGTTVGGALAVNVTGSGADYTVSVSGMTGTGDVVVSVPAGAAQDAAGHPNLAATAIDNSVTFDQFVPTATINQAAGQPDPTNGPIAFAVQFSEPVFDFEPADIDFTGSTVGGELSAAVSGSGSDYVVTVTGMTGAGAVVASIPAGVVTDDLGLGNLASTSTDNRVEFEGIAPSVTVNQSAGQADPTNVSPVSFAVEFGEPVTGFDAADVSLAGSTVGGTLVASVSGTGTSYTVTVSGMFGGGTVVAAVPAGAATDAVGNASLASTSADNAVYFNNIGVLQFDSVAQTATEDSGSATVTVTRIAGDDGPVSIAVGTADGLARAGLDYTAATRTLSWADGESGSKNFVVNLLQDEANEGWEDIVLTLSHPTGDPGLGLATTRVVILPSDPRGPGTFFDSDGDRVKLRLAGPGRLGYYLNDPDGDGRGPIDWLELTDTNPLKSGVTLTTKKAPGILADGRVAVGTVTGPGLKSLSAGKADLVGGGLGVAPSGIALDGYLGSLRIGDVRTGADIVAGATAGRKTRITAGVVGDGRIAVQGPISRLTAASFGPGSVTAPSIGTMTVKGDLAADVTATGAGVAAGKGTLGSLRVKGAIVGSDIAVGGNVTSVSAALFVGSRLFAGYDGPDDGSGAFAGPATIKSFRVTGTADAFADSTVIASVLKTVVLKSVRGANDDGPFGFIANDAIGSLRVTLPAFVYDRFQPLTQGFENFEIRVL